MIDFLTNENVLPWLIVPGYLMVGAVFAGLYTRLSYKSYTDQNYEIFALGEAGAIAILWLPILVLAPIVFFFWGIYRLARGPKK